MKALSVQQPWAWALSHGYKDVENRTWRTRHRGPFLIHAGKSFDMDGYRWIQKHMPSVPLPEPSAFARGAIVGYAKLVDCHEPGSRRSGLCTSPWYFDQFGFEVRNARPVEPVPLAGKLNFFAVPEELVPPL